MDGSEVYFHTWLDGLDEVLDAMSLYDPPSENQRNKRFLIGAFFSRQKDSLILIGQNKHRCPLASANKHRNDWAKVDGNEFG